MTHHYILQYELIQGLQSLSIAPRVSRWMERKGLIESEKVPIASTDLPPTFLYVIHLKSHLTCTVP